MYARHVAYGLDLHCPFPLPGMPETAGENGMLPRLDLRMIDASGLEEAWSGSGSAPDWIGQLGDGCTLSAQRGVEGDWLFSYGDRARFRLDRSGGLLECSPTRLDMHWQRVLLSRVLPNVATMRGYEALHAGVVESSVGAVAIAAPSGTGKTTLALELLRRGWALFADDVLTLGPGERAGETHAHPGTPHMNLDDATPSELVQEIGASTLGMLAGERWITAREHARHPRTVCMIVLLERRPGLPLRAETLAASPLALAPYMLGLAHGSERERTRFTCYSDLMGSARLTRLTADPSASPSQLADLVEEQLAVAPQPPTRAAIGGTP
jgi:hypothetical protein